MAHLAVDIGGDPSLALATVIDQAARLRPVVTIAGKELKRTGFFKGGVPVAAFDPFIRIL